MRFLFDLFVCFCLFRFFRINLRRKRKRIHGEWIKHSVSFFLFYFAFYSSACLLYCYKSTVQSLLWHLDYLGNKRPYDSEFFSFLLKRVLAKDKQKGKSIKLVVKSSKAKKSKGNVLKSGSLRSQNPLSYCIVCVIVFFVFYSKLFSSLTQVVKNPNSLRTKTQLMMMKIMNCAVWTVSVLI